MVLKPVRGSRQYATPRHRGHAGIELFFETLGSTPGRWNGALMTRGCLPIDGNGATGDDYLHAGRLFTPQLSRIRTDFRRIQDAFMRDKGIGYFKNSRCATYVQQR